ncbi:hypothetical protein VQ643_15915, partial [Pseudomonas sp. F1_0610]|uniref:hypothetical protein n=1 Tax=Pseudomonas sp. F1_0610 TaxID=3114284 RepID=UPI0039C2FCB4
MNDINILQKISCLNGCLKGLVEINGDFGEYGAGADIVSFSCGANIFDIVKRRVNSEKYQANIVGDLIKYVSEYIYSMLFVRPFGVDFEVLSSNQKHDLANYAGHESIDIILDILGSNYDDEILEIKFFEEFGDLTVFCLKSYTLDGFLVIYFSKGKVKYKSIINYSRLNQLAGYCLGVSRAGNYALKRSLDVNILSKNNNTSCY